MVWRESMGEVRRIVIEALCAGEEVTERDTLADLRHRKCDYARALLYATLFLPEMRVIEGRVIRTDGIDKWDDPEELRREIVLGGERARAAQENANRLEVGHMFHNPHARETDLAWIRILGDAIAAAWSGWLRVGYPDRVHDVVIENGGEGEDWEELAVTFWEE